MMDKTQTFPNGIVLFKNRINLNEYNPISFLSSIKENSIKNHYTNIYDEDRNFLYAINKSGHRFSKEDITKNCSRITDYYNYFSSDEQKLFFIQCQNTMYQCLLEYIEIYPQILPCLWWKTAGHVLAYDPGSDLGIHCDNDINYQPGFEPDYQLGILHVLAAITYFNSSLSESYKDNFVGGEISFPYADFKYTPQAGDVLMFPANYLGAHQVGKVTDGTRYAFLEYYGQGSSQKDRGIDIMESSQSFFGGQTWMKDLYVDYKEYILNKYGDNHKDLLLPVSRIYNSHGTKRDVDAAER